MSWLKSGKPSLRADRPEDLKIVKTFLEMNFSGLLITLAKNRQAKNAKH